VAAFLLIRAGRDDLPDTDATVIGNDLTDQAPSMTTKGNYDV
jgi:hypothetical protein